LEDRLLRSAARVSGWKDWRSLLCGETSLRSAEPAELFGPTGRVGNKLKSTGCKRLVDAVVECPSAWRLFLFLDLKCRRRSGLLFLCFIHIALTVTTPLPNKRHSDTNEAAATTKQNQRRRPAEAVFKHSC
jgi:hypothetical protein